MKTYAIILAAGKGTRFGQSAINKTAFNLGQKTIIQHGLDRLPSTISKIYVVVGHLKESVINSITTPSIVYVEQEHQEGTAQAILLALLKMKKENDIPDNVLIASGDHLFMISSDTLSRLINRHIYSRANVTILTTKVNKAEGRDNGRIIRKLGRVEGILEKSELDKKQQKIKELNTGTYVFGYKAILDLLENIDWSNPGRVVITHEIFKLKSISSYREKYEKVGGGINTMIDLELYLKKQLKNAVKNVNKKKNVHRLVELFILFAILLVLMGKFLFGPDENINFLLIYGVIVTVIIWMTFFFAFIVYKDPYELALAKKNYATKKEELPLVSCMVAVHNEELNIGRCIDSMLRQSYTKREIIVVNDASSDGTLKILREYEKENKIVVIDLVHNVGKKKALGEAMTIAKGSIFAHTDSDSAWAFDAIEKMVTIFQHDHDVGAISGHGRALNGDHNLLTKIQDSWMEGQFSARKAFESVFNSVSCVSGPLAVFRKEAIFNYLPAWVNDSFLGQEFRFATDRTLTGLVLGSKYIGKKVKKKFSGSSFVKVNNYSEKNWKVLYSKSAKSWTIVPDSMSKFIKQQVRWKKSFIRNIFFTGSFYWKKPFPTAFVYYFHIVLVFMGPFITFKHLIYLPYQGNLSSGLLYLSGIVFVGLMFGIACKLEEKDSNRWMYRPLMSLMSTLVISWLIFYSGITIRRMSWSRS